MEGKYGEDEKMARSESRISKRVSIKSQSNMAYSISKQKLIENIYRRIREDRTRLLWKLRHSHCHQYAEEKEFINSAFKDIVSGELKKIEDSSRNLSGNPNLPHDSDDTLWEYEGLKDAYESDNEEILLELQQIFYKDLLSETTINESHVQIETWEDEEDDYLATLVSQSMLLNNEQEQNQIWCPICKQGELMENQRHIHCNMCRMQMNKGEEVNLNILKDRLAEAHAEHLERGCRLKPKFSIQSHYDLKALYITCEACNTFEVVV